jgi:hypothetical protein
VITFWEVTQGIWFMVAFGLITRGSISRQRRRPQRPVQADPAGYAGLIPCPRATADDLAVL